MRASILAILTSTAVLAVGCGGNVTSLDPLAEAAERTQDAPTARFVLEATIRDPDEGTIAFRGPGAIADHGRLMSMRMTMPARMLDPELGKGDVEFEMIAAGDAFYFSGGPFSDLGEGKKWLKVRDDAPFPDLGQNDPSQMLEYLQATAEIRELGQARVRGVATKRYSARIQLAKLAERISSESGKSMRRALEQAESSGIKEIPLEVWVSRDGFVRRLEMDWSVGGAGLVFTMDLFDFGTEVDVRVPPPSQVLDVSELLEEEEEEESG